MQDFARNQVGHLASSVLTLQPDSHASDSYHPNRLSALSKAQSPAATAALGWDDFDSSPGEASSAIHDRDSRNVGEHHPDSGFQEVPLQDSPMKGGGGTLGDGRAIVGGSGAAASVAALRRENAGLRQRLAAVELVGVPHYLSEQLPCYSQR